MNNTRAKAGAILSAAKMRMLEAEGITVVTKARLEALENLRLECQRRDDAVNAIIVANLTGDEEQKRIERSNEFSAFRAINEILEELEAME